MMFSKSNHTNCEGDFEGFLLKLGQLTGDKTKNDPTTPCVILNTVPESVCNDYSMPKENAMSYLAGYIIRKTNEKFVCASCYCKWTCNSG